MPIRIMIADDHAVFRSGLRAILEKEKDMAVVHETGTGMDTISAARNHKIDVLILDINMPGIRGPQVAQEILRKNPKMAIVVLTMYEDEYYVQELFKIGVLGFVLKKSTGPDLLRAIRAAYDGKQYIDPELAGYVISPYVGKKSKSGEGRLSLITTREREVARLLAFGHTNAEIAKTLHISQRTVESHRTNIMSKLDLSGRAALVQFAIDHGLMKT